MTEHEHMPPIHKYTTKWLTKDRLLIRFPSVEYVWTRDEAKALRDVIDAALDGPGPEIVCEVVEQVRL